MNFTESSMSGTNKDDEEVPNTGKEVLEVGDQDELSKNEFMVDQEAISSWLARARRDCRCLSGAAYSGLFVQTSK